MNAIKEQFQNSSKKDEIGSCLFHKAEPLMVCLQMECDNCRLCCLTCIDQYHQKHELVSIDKFKAILKSLKQQFDPKMQQAIIKVMKNHKQQMIKMLEQQIQITMKLYQQLKNYIQSKYQAILTKLQQQPPSNNETTLTNQNTNKYWTLAQQFQNRPCKSSQQTFALTSQYESKFKDKLYKAKIGYASLNNELAVYLDKAQNKFLNQAAHRSEAKFSPNLKSSCIQLYEQGKVIKRVSGSGGYPICLLQNPLSVTNTKASFRIEEQPGKVGIWFGICSLPIVQSLNFQSCYGLNKGTYAIDQVSSTHPSAFSWSHHSAAHNSTACVGWQFLGGQVVTVQISYQNQNVTFSKGQEKYVQPINIQLGEWHAFAGPTFLNDVIRVL